MPDYKQKTIRFMRAIFVPDRQNQVQTAVAHALDRHRRALARQEPLTLQGDTFRLINTRRTVNGCLCGALFCYTRGQNAVAVSLDAAATELDVTQVAPPTEDGLRRREFIDSLLLFALHQNHVVLIGSQAMHSKQFEDHLNWLLSPERGAQLDADQKVMLADPETVARRRQRVSQVKSLHFSTGIGVEQGRVDAHDRQQMSFRPAGERWQAMVAFLESMGVRIPAIDFDPSLRPDDLRVEVEIIHRKRRDQMEGATPVLDPIANAFRHHEDVPCEIEFRDGTRLRGEDLRVTASKSIPCDNGIPRLAESFRIMTTWLEEIIARPDIVA